MFLWGVFSLKRRLLNSSIACLAQHWLQHTPLANNLECSLCCWHFFLQINWTNDSLEFDFDFSLKNFTPAYTHIFTHPQSFCIYNGDRHLEKPNLWYDAGMRCGRFCSAHLQTADHIQMSTNRLVSRLGEVVSPSTPYSIHPSQHAQPPCWQSQAFSQTINCPWKRIR